MALCSYVQTNRCEEIDYCCCHCGDCEKIVATHAPPLLLSLGPSPSLSLSLSLTPTAQHKPPRSCNTFVTQRLCRIAVTNKGDRPIQVGSHYHFIETNGALLFDREQSYGKRLNVGATTV